MNKNALFLSLLLGVSSVSVLSLQPEAAIAKAPYFTTQQQLEAKFSLIKKGWTRARVESLLGKPQWGNARTYNYFVEAPNGSSAGNEMALEFDANGVVVKIGGGAG